VYLQTRPGRDHQTDPIIRVKGVIRQGTDGCVGCVGVVAFELLDEHTAKPGVYLADVGLFSADNYLVQTWPCYIALEATAFTDPTKVHGRGPLTISELRMAMLDLPGLEVSLLDNPEFTDQMILSAMTRPIDLWNESPPRVGMHTVNDFPYRFHWIEGTLAILFSMATAGYMRNHLAYSAGGVSIDDQNKYREYGAAAKDKMETFRAWMQVEKRRLNARQAWRNIGV
jgi:hypothetical protein